MITVTILTALAAFVVAIMAGTNRGPLWVAVVLLSIAVLLQFLPR